MRFSTAMAVSIGLHCLLAAGLAAYINYAPGPTTLATLDLSSVELSFAEEDDASASVAPSLPAPPPLEPPVPPDEKPPESEMPDEPPPPDPDAPSMPKPEPERERMEPLDVLPEEKPKEVEKPRETPPPAPPAPAVAPKQAKVDAPPKPRKAIRPEYPKGPRQRGEQGDVVLEIRVTESGNVDRVEVVSSCGFPELDEAAERAAKAARFTPAKSGSRSVASTAWLTLTFRLK